MIWLRRFSVAGSLFLLTGVLLPAEIRPASEQKAIDWLLTQIETSNAVFLRNGSEYDGKKAASHLRFKLRSAGRRVQTARDFIKGIAARSETSGKPYEIRTQDGRQILLEKWLGEKLATFEKDSGSR